MKDDQQIAFLHVVILDQAIRVARRALDLQVLQRLAKRADVVPHDRIDAREPAGPEEHLDEHHHGVPPPP